VDALHAVAQAAQNNSETFSPMASSATALVLIASVGRLFRGAPRKIASLATARITALVPIASVGFLFRGVSSDAASLATALMTALVTLLVLIASVGCLVRGAPRKPVYLLSRACAPSHHSPSPTTCLGSLEAFLVEKAGHRHQRTLRCTTCSTCCNVLQFPAGRPI
jgi:hypothetical protein